MSTKQPDYKRQCINCGFVGSQSKHVCHPRYFDNSDLKYLKPNPNIPRYVPGQFNKKED